MKLILLLRTVSSLLALWLGLAFADPARAQPRDTLTLGMSQFPPDMHPQITNTAIKDTILQSVNRPMTGYARDGAMVCVLCADLPSLDNGEATLIARADGTTGMQVTYTLKPGLFWADGVPVTAGDVVFTFEVSRAFNPPPTIEAAEALDDRHVRFTLNKTVYDYPRIATSFATSAIISEHIEGPVFRAARDPLEYGEKSAFNHNPTEPGLWLGPYRVAEFRPNESVVLAPNPFWQGDKPWFRKVTLKLVENTAALQANLLSGDVDTVAPGNLGLSLDQIIALAKTQADRFDFSFIPAVASYEHLALNLDNPLLADTRVRHAMSMAIDRKAIVARLFDNRFEMAGSFKHPTQPGWDPATKTWLHDPKAARALLAEAGFTPGADGILHAQSGARFSVDLMTTSGNRVRELVEQVLQTEMRAIGIELVIKNQPARVLFGQSLRRREFTGLVLFQNDMQLDYVPIAYFDSRYVPSDANHFSGLNYMDLHDPAMDQAMAAVRAELDPNRRRALWRPVLDLYAELMPEIPLYFPATGLVTPKWMTGIENPNRFGQVTAWIEEWHAR